MPRKTVSKELGEAEALEEAADKKLNAARKMQKANAILGEDEEEDLQLPPQEELELPEPEPSKLDSIMQEIGGDGKFEVYKVIGGAKAKIGVFGVNDWPDMMEVIARQHGGGTYTVIFKNKNGHFAGQDTLSYDPEAYAKNGVEKKTGESDALVTKMIEMMEKREQSLQLEVASLRKEQTAMMLEFMKASQSKQSTLFQSAEDVAMIAKLFQREPQEKATQGLGAIKEVVELLHLLREDSPLGEPAPAWQIAIDKAFKVLDPVLGAWAKKLAPPTVSPVARLENQPSKPVAQPPTKAAPDSVQEVTSAHVPTPTNGAEESPAPNIDPRIRDYANSLLTAVSNGMTPEQTGNMIIDATPEESWADLEAMIKDPALVGNLLEANVQLKAFQPWLVALTKYIEQELEPVEDVEEPAPEPVPEPAGATA